MNKQEYDNISFQPEKEIPLFEKQYGCLFSFTVGEEETTLKYELNIKFVKKLSHSYLFLLDRTTPVYINDQQLDTLVDNLAYDAGCVFYPLQIEVNTNGKFAAIRNQNEIRARWPSLKEKIERYYKGKEVAKYLSLMEETLYSDRKMHEVFKNDLFISTFFRDIYKSYTSLYSLNSESLYPVVGSTSPLLFSVIEELNPQLTKQGKIEISHWGNLIDERTCTEIEDGYNWPVSKMMDNPDTIPAKGKHQAIYSLDNKTKEIKSVVGRWELYLSTTNIVEVRIFQMSTDEESPFLVNEEKEKAKKSFFSKLLN